MAIKVLCPKCGKQASVAEENLGRTVRCKDCSSRFKAKATGESQPAAKETFRNARKEPVAAAAGLPAETGGFEVRGILGEGAFGQVLLGYDRNLKRLVALKVPHPGTFATPRAIERFEREARAVAQLRHPHIVPIYAAGHDGTHHYIAAQFIPGPDGQKARTLAEAIEAGKIHSKNAARIVRDLAEALAYAHEQGIVHRDVKPANVLLDEKGRPHLTDFGMAHQQDQSVKITQDGAVLGTPAYMAPEQARGQKDDPLPASDQYSLGMVLYELLCGEVAFTGPVGLVLSRQINEEPQAPHRVRADVPHDLETICLKALSKRPEERYASCQDMAEDLRRFLEDEPIHARPLGLAERGVRWVRRNPVIAALVAMVVLSLVAGTAISTYYGVLARSNDEQAQLETKRAGAKAVEAEKNAEQAQQETEKAKKAGEREAAQAKQAKEKAREADEERQKKQVQLDRAEMLAYVGQITLAHREWEDGDSALAWHHLESCQWNLRGWEHRYLYTLFTRNQITGHTGPVYSVAFNPDGKHIVSASGDSTVKVWDAVKGSEILSLKGHTGEVRSVAFSPDGKRIVSASYDMTVKVWDANKGSETLTLKGHSGPVQSVAFSPDGKRIVSGSEDGTVKVWEAHKESAPHAQGDANK